MQWEVVIGLETHVQLSTQSKIFFWRPHAISVMHRMFTLATLT